MTWDRRVGVKCSCGRALWVLLDTTEGCRCGVHITVSSRPNGYVVEACRIRPTVTVSPGLDGVDHS